MKVAIRQSVLCVLALAGIISLTTHDRAVGQDAARSDDKKSPSEVKSGNGRVKLMNPSEFKSLDQIRQSAPWETISDVNSGFNVAFVEHSSRPDPRMVALKKIEEMKSKLKASEDRSEVEPLLRAALAEYFMADMRHRVRELDEIKAKVAESEARLQKRLDSQQESVDLQLKIMLREADGAGFFRAEDASGISEAAVPRSNPNVLGLGPMVGVPWNELGGFGEIEREKKPVTAELQPLTEALASTQTLVLAVNDTQWEHYRLPTSFDDESYKQLAGAILRALGTDADAKNLLKDSFSATLGVRFSSERYEQVGKNIPSVIEVLKKSSDARQKQKAEAVTQELLGNN